MDWQGWQEEPSTEQGTGTRGAAIREPVTHSNCAPMAAPEALGAIATSEVFYSNLQSEVQREIF